jgi:antitoxin component YwqK of YwqJK toxin-antitoxin module
MDLFYMNIKPKDLSEARTCNDKINQFFNNKTNYEEYVKKHSHFEVNTNFLNITHVKPYYGDELHGVEESYIYIKSFEIKKIISRIEWNFGVKNGKEEHYYENGVQKCEIFWVNGKRDQIEKSYFPNGNHEFVRQWDLNVLVSETHWYSNGNQAYVFNWKNNLPHGNCEEWYKNGIKSLSQEWDNGFLHGFEYQWYESGNQKFLISWNHGIKDGNEEQWDETNSSFLFISWKDGDKIYEEKIVPSRKKNNKDKIREESFLDLLYDVLYTTLFVSWVPHSIWKIFQ